MNLKIILTVLVSVSIIIQAQSPLPLSSRLDSIIVYGFSQSNCFSNADKQIIDFHPDINIRAWSKWQNEGTEIADFNKNAIDKYKQNRILIIGGLTSTVYFFSEAADSQEFLDMVTRDADNSLVPHSEIYSNAYRGNLANPRFRQYIIKIAKVQIDAGVDGIFFDEANAGYSGSSYDGNEGFDDYHQKDFNRYLLQKYPDFTFTQWCDTFKMDSSNCLKKDVSPEDLEQNFNYRTYLQKNGWSDSPLSSINPLAKEWGRAIQNRPAIDRKTFLDKYTMEVYWKEIVTAVRDYSRNTYGKEILITSNGIFPYVDFNCVGLYNYNVDDNGSEAKYVPVKNNRLNGSVSLANIFRKLYQRNAAVSGSVPCVLFLDWPTDMMSSYYNFKPSEKMDYWRIYAGEAYAHGLFFSFHFRTSMGGDPTAKSSGIFDSLVNYAQFYKDHRELYQKAVLTDSIVQVSAAKVTASLTSQSERKRYLIHLINHNYDGGINPQLNVKVTIPDGIQVKRIKVFSPDRAAISELPVQRSENVVYCSVDTLLNYTILSLESEISPVMNRNNELKAGRPLPDNDSKIVNLLGKTISISQSHQSSLIHLGAAPGIYIKRLDGNDKKMTMVK